MTLTQLVALLEKSHGRFSLDEISRALEVPPGALAGMIETLVRKGVLLEIGPDGGWCAACGLRNECNLLVVHGARYVVVPRRREHFTFGATCTRSATSDRSGGS